ncbi:MAG TPA: dicarboxylate/amino acid:cation symporter [Paludibaculum sp.]
MRIRNPQAAGIFAAMIGGAVFGLLLPEASGQLGWLSDIFLRLIRAVIGPLLFGVIVTSVADAGGAQGLGRIGWRSLVYFEITTTLALALGWAAVAFFDLGAAAGLTQTLQAASPPAAKPLSALLVEVFPASIFDALAQGNILQILIFFLLLGVAAGAIREKAQPLVRFAASVTAISYEITRLVMWLAPAAVFAAIAGTVAHSSRETMASLGGFVAAAWGAQALFLVAVIGVSLLAARMPLRSFVTAVEEPFLVAFATTSSAAALPKSLEAMERLGISRRIYGVVTPLSLSLNLTGSCIHLAMCAFFAARAAGIVLSPAQQIMILLTLKLTSKGVAGIPRANFIILAGLFSTFGLPAEMLAVLLGIDALIDPVRTSVNVMGHCAASPLIARWEQPPMRCVLEAE